MTVRSTDHSMLGGAPLRPTDVAGRMDRWGFLAHPDLPDGPGPAFLLVALRPVPTLEHYDPEAVEYWVASDGRGERRTLTHTLPLPRSEAFSWGLIRLVDRLGISNEYLTFGGHLDAAEVDGVVIAAFTSPAPILRRGGHSQAWDAGADAVGAFFGRLLAAVDVTPGFEARLAAATPLTRYAAFLRDRGARSWRPGPAVRGGDDLEPETGAEHAGLRGGRRGGDELEERRQPAVCRVVDRVAAAGQDVAVVGGRSRRQLAGPDPVGAPLLARPAQEIDPVLVVARPARRVLAVEHRVPPGRHTYTIPGV